MPGSLWIEYIVRIYLSFLLAVIWYQVFQSNMNNSANRSIWPIHKTLIGTTAMGHSDIVNNGNEGALLTLRALEQEFHHQMQFRVILRIASHPFRIGSYPSAETQAQLAVWIWIKKKWTIDLIKIPSKKFYVRYTDTWNILCHYFSLKWCRKEYKRNWFLIQIRTAIRHHMKNAELTTPLLISVTTTSLMMSNQDPATNFNPLIVYVIY